MDRFCWFLCPVIAVFGLFVLVFVHVTIASYVETCHLDDTVCASENRLHPYGSGCDCVISFVDAKNIHVDAWVLLICEEVLYCPLKTECSEK